MLSRSAGMGRGRVGRLVEPSVEDTISILRGLRERLEELRRDLADLRAEADAKRAQWEAERQAIRRVQALRQELEQVRQEADEAERAYGRNQNGREVARQVGAVPPPALLRWAEAASPNRRLDRNSLLACAFSLNRGPCRPGEEVKITDKTRSMVRLSRALGIPLTPKPPFLEAASGQHAAAVPLPGRRHLGAHRPAGPPALRAEIPVICDRLVIEFCSR